VQPQHFERHAFAGAGSDAGGGQVPAAAQDWRYAAFISYAHKDGAMAAQLHRRLEAYRPQKSLRAKRNQLRPIFRDLEELTAHHSLSTKIRQAVEGSRRLIVLCSPAAKTSKWVNAEIRLFRDLHGEGAILCALLEGTPETSFPEALTEGGREPLAANLSGGKENFRIGVLQLAASLLDVGLDDLVRRDARRRRRLFGSVALGALLFSGFMAAATYSALQSQKQAEANRAEAEGLVEYMITELKGELEPVGRLDIIDGVGDRVMSYYETQSLSEMPQDRILRYARALHLLAQVDMQARRFAEAKESVQKSYELTQMVMMRYPSDKEAVFAHAQSAFYKGDFLRATQGQEGYKPYWKEYYALTQQLYAFDSQNFDWVMEAAFGENNMGIIYRYEGDFDMASTHYDKAITFFDEALSIDPDNELAQSERLNTIVGAEQLSLARGEYGRAMRYRRDILTAAQEQHARDSRNFQSKGRLAAAQSNFVWQYNLLLSQEELETALLTPLSSLEALYKHDSDNAVWRERYYWHLILAAKLTRQKEKKLMAIDRAQSVLADGVYRKRFRLFLQDLNIQKHSLMGRTQDARRLARHLADEAFKEAKKRVKRTPSTADSLGTTALRLYELGEGAAAKAQASAHLEYIDGMETNELDALFYQAYSHYILGDCAKAQNILSPILKNGAGTHPALSPIVQCQN
jgi:tetratricopeptide (TPR) repeat protein